MAVSMLRTRGAAFNARRPDGNAVRLAPNSLPTSIEMKAAPMRRNKIALDRLAFLAYYENRIGFQVYPG